MAALVCSNPIPEQIHFLIPLHTGKGYVSTFSKPIAFTLSLPATNGIAHVLTCSVASVAGPLAAAQNTKRVTGIGIVGSAGASLGIQLVADPKGNVGLSLSGSFSSILVGASAMVGVQGTVTNATGIQGLKGPSGGLNFSFGAGPAVDLGVQSGSSPNWQKLVGPYPVPQPSVLGRGKSLRVLIVFCLILQASRAAQRQPATAKPAAETADAEKHPEPVIPPDEKPSVTHHKITVRGKALSYTATAGHMPIKNEQGKIEAEMFFVAYTLDESAKDSASAAKRPLTFAFNGGPGSATVWLHMGCFGPKRVKMLPNGFMPPPPFELEDNQDTILNRSDLIFVDAIGTGYSRASTPELGKKFWSVSGDIAAFGEFIRVYLQQNSRWTSPVYLAGESYGTTRAAGLSGFLVDHGIALNGIILISTILNFETVSFTTGNDLPYVLYLPTYAMTAAYHHKLATELEQNPEALRKEVEQWAATDYTQALQQGDSLTPGTRESVADHLARYTGLSKAYIERSNLRVDLSQFDSELLRDEGKTVGRLDGRFTGVNENGNQQFADYDPSEAAIRPPYTAAFGNYVKQELGYQNDTTYYILGGGIGHWDYGLSGWSGFADTSAGLRHAFAKNPFMQVYVAEGYYDSATPYFAAEYTFNHMGLTSANHKNVTRGQYNAGHMVYIDNESMDKLHRDVDALFDRAGAK